MEISLQQNLTECTWTRKYACCTKFGSTMVLSLQVASLELATQLKVPCVMVGRRPGTSPTFWRAQGHVELMQILFTQHALLTNLCH